MSTTKDGGQAFPRAGAHIRTLTGEMYDKGDVGMTLRDYFAAKAMQGWLATYGPSDQHPSDRGFCGVVAEQAYALADAMQAARKAQP